MIFERGWRSTGHSKAPITPAARWGPRFGVAAGNAHSSDSAFSTPRLRQLLCRLLDRQDAMLRTPLCEAARSVHARLSQRRLRRSQVTFYVAVTAAACAQKERSSRTHHRNPLCSATLNSRAHAHTE